MAISYKISAADFDKLPDAIKDEYTKSGDGYVLDLTGVDLKAAEKYEGERSKRRDAEKRANEAETKLQEFQDGDDRPALVAKHEKETAKLTKAKEDAEKRYTDYMVNTTKSAAANDLAAQLSKTAPKVLLPHINSRLDVDMSDPLAPKAIVLGPDGKPSGKSLDDLKAEFLANKDFSAIVTGSLATGGAASRPGVTGRSGLPSGAGTPPNQGQPLDLSTVAPSQLVAHLRSAGLVDKAAS